MSLEARNWLLLGGPECDDVLCGRFSMVLFEALGATLAPFVCTPESDVACDTCEGACVDTLMLFVSSCVRRAAVDEELLVQPC